MNPLFSLFLNFPYVCISITTQIFCGPSRKGLMASVLCLDLRFTCSLITSHFRLCKLLAHPKVPPTRSRCIPKGLNTQKIEPKDQIELLISQPPISSVNRFFSHNDTYLLTASFLDLPQLPPSLLQVALWSWKHADPNTDSNLGLGSPLTHNFKQREHWGVLEEMYWLSSQLL